MSDTMEVTEAIESRYTGIMAEMNDSGDTKILWDKNNQDEVDNARSQFEKLTKEKGFAAFAVKKNGDQGERVRVFDPEAERIILVPQLRGG